MPPLPNVTVRGITQLTAWVSAAGLVATYALCSRTWKQTHSANGANGAHFCNDVGAAAARVGIPLGGDCAKSE